MTHSSSSQGDRIDPAAVPPQPFQFLTGADNPVVKAGALPALTDVLVSDSLVTVPVVDISSGPPVSPIQIIGFVQLFLNPDGNAATGPIETRVINLAGCGINATTPPILGNGASPIPVRLVSNQ
jgi:hypothetical protein